MDLKEAKENLKPINADHKNQWKKLFADMRPQLICLNKQGQILPSKSIQE